MLASSLFKEFKKLECMERKSTKVSMKTNVMDENNSIT
jgi:hypothetical protein